MQTMVSDLSGMMHFINSSCDKGTMSVVVLPGMFGHGSVTRQLVKAVAESNAIVGCT